MFCFCCRTTDRAEKNEQRFDKGKVIPVMLHWDSWDKKLTAYNLYCVSSNMDTSSAFLDSSTGETGSLL